MTRFGISGGPLPIRMIILSLLWETWGSSEVWWQGEAMHCRPLS